MLQTVNVSCFVGGALDHAIDEWRRNYFAALNCTTRGACPWRIVISPSQMACNAFVTSLFFRLLISKVLLVLTRHSFASQAIGM